MEGIYCILLFKYLITNLIKHFLTIPDSVGSLIEVDLYKLMGSRCENICICLNGPTFAYKAPPTKHIVTQFYHLNLLKQFVFIYRGAKRHLTTNFVHPYCKKVYKFQFIV